MRATDEAMAGYQDVDLTQMLEAMGRYNDELIHAGVLVSAEGLDDPSTGVVVDFAATPPLVVAGPYGETRELFGGYWILDVPTLADAVEWATKMPMTRPGLKTEIRRITGIDEFPQDNPWIQKERAWRESTGQL
jgi:hypothetical protein